MALSLWLSKTRAFLIHKCEFWFFYYTNGNLELTFCSLFLYCFLLACAVAVGYFFYTIWIVPYFPQKRKQTTKKASAKKIEVGSVQSDNEGPAISTGAKTYNEEWIPTHHIQRPEARRVKSGGRPKSRGKPE